MPSGMHTLGRPVVLDEKIAIGGTETMKMSCDAARVYYYTGQSMPEMVDWPPTLNGNAT